jgi:hypothetical protein
MTTAIFKNNYLFDLPEDVKQIIKKQKEELDVDSEQLQERVCEMTNADFAIGECYLYIFDTFKYMNDEEFKDIDYEEELMRAIRTVSTQRDHICDLKEAVADGTLAEEDYEWEENIVNKETEKIKKMVNDYGVFKLLKIIDDLTGEKIDFSEESEEFWYDLCFSYMLYVEFNSKISYEEIVKIRNYDLDTEYR